MGNCVEGYLLIQNSYLGIIAHQTPLHTLISCAIEGVYYRLMALHGIHTLLKEVANALACYVADMSPTRANVAKSWPTLRVLATQKRPRHTQFISITTDKYKSAQTYGYLSYHRVFVFELKQQS